MPSKPAKRRVGRPRTVPVDARERKWWATDAEMRRVEKAAEAESCSVQELVRRRMLTPEGKS